MERSTVLAILTLFTLLSGMAVASYQLWVAERAKKPDNPTKIGGPTRT
jgi:hypothetical protein